MAGIFSLFAMWEAKLRTVFTRDKMFEEFHLTRSSPFLQSIASSSSSYRNSHGNFGISCRGEANQPDSGCSAVTLKLLFSTPFFPPQLQNLVLRTSPLLQSRLEPADSNPLPSTHVISEQKPAGWLAGKD